VAQRAVVAPNGDLKDGTMAVSVQAAVTIVVTDSIGGGEVCNPSGFEQGDQPSLMLPGYGHRSRNRNGQGTAQPNGAIQDGINAAEERSTKCRKAVSNQFINGLALIDSSDVYFGTAQRRFRHASLDLTRTGGGNSPFAP